MPVFVITTKVLMVASDIESAQEELMNDDYRFTSCRQVDMTTKVIASQEVFHKCLKLTKACYEVPQMTYTQVTLILDTYLRSINIILDIDELNAFYSTCECMSSNMDD